MELAGVIVDEAGDVVEEAGLVEEFGGEHGAAPASAVDEDALSGGVGMSGGAVFVEEEFEEEAEGGERSGEEEPVGDEEGEGEGLAGDEEGGGGPGDGGGGEDDPDAEEFGRADEGAPAEVEAEGPGGGEFDGEGEGEQRGPGDGRMEEPGGGGEAEADERGEAGPDEESATEAGVGFEHGWGHEARRRMRETGAGWAQRARYWPRMAEAMRAVV